MRRASAITRREAEPEPGPHFHYARHRPAAAGCVVDEYWTIQAERCTTLVEQTLPDAAAEIYFNLGPAGRHVYTASGAALGSLPARRLPRAAWVVGPHAHPLLVAKETEDCDIVGVRLRPGCVARVLGVPARELAGRLVDLDCLWGPVVEEIRERLAAAAGPGERVAIVEETIARRLGAPAGSAARAAADVPALCASAAGSDTVGGVARAFGLTHRRVIRLFDDHVGLKPKAYHRVQRLRRVMEGVGSARLPSWAELAVRSGYYDQAHMIHEFRALTGLTPGEYAARKTSVGHGYVPHLRVARG